MYNVSRHELSFIENCFSLTLYSYKTQNIFKSNSHGLKVIFFKKLQSWIKSILIILTIICYYLENASRN